MLDCLCSLFTKITCVPSISYFLGFPGGSDGKESAFNASETWVWSLGWEDLLKKEMATHSSILAWRIPCTEEPGTSLIAHSVKNLPAVQKTRVWFLGREDPWEKEMATHSSVLAWRISRGAWQDGVARVGHDLATKPSPPLHHTRTPPPPHQHYLKSCLLDCSSHFAPNKS